ncbi:MAG: hypothetical protein JWN38_231 [Candidatus Saccharibacteria bacterium]|nr:hypothetical protein [Candidatus Saccharibacteria bacterium]
MSIACYEDGSQLVVAKEAFCVTTRAAEQYSALCSRHVIAIPAVERLPEPVEGGLDIHFLFAGPNGYSPDPHVDTLSLRSMQFGDYRFSLRPELAQLILPRACELFLGQDSER